MTLQSTISPWWEGLEGRERKLLLVGGAFVVAAVLYTLVYPVFLAHGTARDEVIAADRDYRWLKEQVRILAEVRDAAGGILPVSLPIAAIKEKIERDMEERKITGRAEIENTATDERITISVERAPGKKLMSWLEELAGNGYAITTIKLRNNGGFLTGTIAVGS